MWHGLKRLRLSRIFALAGTLVLTGILMASALGVGQPAAQQADMQVRGRLELVSVLEVLSKVGQQTLANAQRAAATTASSNVLGSSTQAPAIPPDTGSTPAANMPSVGGSPYAGHWVQPPQPSPTQPSGGAEPSDPVHAPICGGCGSHKYLSGHYFCAMYCRDQIN
jgi:hypothetical protein